MRSRSWRRSAATRPSSLKPALRALFCATHSDWEKFDEIFEAFWRGRGMRRAQTLGGSGSRAPRPRRRNAGNLTARPPACPITSSVSKTIGDAAGGRGRREGASSAENIVAADLRHITDPDDIARAHALAARLARTMRARLVRREQVRRRGRRLDLRRTIHRNVSHGGTPIDLAWRRRKIKPLRLVVLLDASGSMNLYTAFFVRFLHGVVDAFREAEAFVFHTRLAHVSASLRDRDVTRAVDRLGLMAQGIGGGTRIGDSLATFNRWHARRVDQFAHRRDDRLRRLRHRRAGAARRRDAPAAPALPPHHLAQPADRLARLQPAGARHAGRAAICRPVRAGAQSREPGGARAVPREDLIMSDHATDILDTISSRKAQGKPFALATVVRTVAATAAKAGAKAVILPDGTISEGWIGGGCARAAVLKAAREALADGKPRLVSVQPPDALQDQGIPAGEERGGVRFAKNMCPSQGTMDIFVEPVLPRPQIVVCGASPVAVAIADLGRRIGFDVTVCAPPAEQAAFGEVERRIEGYALPVDEAGARFVVVSTQGRGDEAALQAALAVDADYVAFRRQPQEGRGAQGDARGSAVSRRSAWQGSRHRPASTSARSRRRRLPSRSSPRSWPRGAADN